MRAMSQLARLARRYGASESGNFAILTAILLMVLLFALGMAYDLTMAQSRKDQINGMADVAALGAVTPTMMTNSAANSQTAAANLFSSQIATVTGVVYQPGNLSAVANDSVNGTTVTRTVTVNYTAASQNVFAGVLGMPTFPIAGSSSASASVAPNIDFFLLLDTSPSMEIGATDADIAKLQAATVAQQSNATPAGCAFGCHETNPTASDVKGNPNGEDNYTLARNLGVTMRIDRVKTATSTLMGDAETIVKANIAKYRAALYTIDYTFNKLYLFPNDIPQYTESSGESLTDLSAAGTASQNIAPLEVYSNNNVTNGNNNNDEDTGLDGGVSSINALMPAPGNGTNTKNDTPQEVLFIVTDGLNDTDSNGTRVYTPIDSSGQNLCSTIKARGIRIAVLYTTYVPLDNGAIGGPTWYDKHVESVQPNIAAAAQACASPGLYFEVNTSGDIPTAMTALFQKVVATAHLTH